MNAVEKVKLSDGVLDHIIRRHPEVRHYVDNVLETASNPDIIVEGLRGELKALKFYSGSHVGSKYLVVVYREVRGEKVIITAYFTSDVRKVKGEVVWRR